MTDGIILTSNSNLYVSHPVVVIVKRTIFVPPNTTEQMIRLVSSDLRHPVYNTAYLFVSHFPKIFDFNITFILRVTESLITSVVVLNIQHFMARLQQRALFRASCQMAFRSTTRRLT